MSGLFAFHGIDAKIGTTMISQSVAETIAAARKDLSVMLISLNGRPGTEYMDRVGESIEGIKLYLDNRVLSRKELLQACKKRDNFYMLAGVMSLGQARYYKPDQAFYLLDSLAQDVDLIIADTGNDLENGLTLGGLEHIKESCCLISQQESMLKRYETLLPVYRNLEINFAFYCINQYTEKDPYSLDYISKRLSLKKEDLQKIQITPYGRRAEMEMRSLLAYKQDSYSSDILDLANRVLTQCGMGHIGDGRKRRWNHFISMTI